MLGFICWYVCVFFNNTQTRIIGPTTTNGRVMHTPVLFCFVCFFVCLFVCVFVLTCESILRGEGNAHTCRETLSWSGSAGRRSAQARRKTTTKLLQFSINFNSFLQCFQRQTSPEATTFVSAFKPGRSTSDISGILLLKYWDFLKDDQVWPNYQTETSFLCVWVNWLSRRTIVGPSKLIGLTK